MIIIGLRRSSTALFGAESASDDQMIQVVQYNFFFHVVAEIKLFVFEDKLQIAEKNSGTFPWNQQQ